MTSTAGELQQKVALILSQATQAATIYRFRDSSFDFDERTRRFGPPMLPIANPGDAEVTNEQVLLLKTLYSECPEHLRGTFTTALLSNLAQHTVPAIVHALIDLGHLAELGRFLNENKDLTLNVRSIVWYRIREKLACEPHRFSDDDLRKVEEMRRAEIARTPKSDPWSAISF